MYNLKEKKNTGSTPVSNRFEALSTAYAVICNVKKEATKPKSVEGQEPKEPTIYVKFMVASAEEVEGVNNEWSGRFSSKRVLCPDMTPLYLTENNQDIVVSFLSELSVAATGSCDLYNTFAAASTDLSVDEFADAVVEYLAQFEEKPFWWVLGGVYKEGNDEKTYLNGRGVRYNKSWFTNSKGEEFQIPKNVFESEDKADNRLRELAGQQIGWNKIVSLASHGNPDEEAVKSAIKTVGEATYSQKLFKDERADKVLPSQIKPDYVGAKLISLGFDDDYYNEVYRPVEESGEADLDAIFG